MKNDDKKSQERLPADRLIDALKEYPNTKKKGELADMIKRDDFHNRNQSEEDYRAEQQAWLESIRKKKKPADSY